jgi:putative tricarboxylic transport membrane protein
MIIIAFCLAVYWQTTLFERVPPILKRGIQPSDFPQLVLMLIIALSIFVILTDKDPAPEKLDRQVVISIGLLVVFALVAEIDFFLGLGVFATALCFQWGERRKWALLLVGIVIPLIVFFFFDSVFEVRFPRGLLTNLWYG